MLIARVCRCGKDLSKSWITTPIPGVAACPSCGKGVLLQDDPNRVAWKRYRKVDASLTRFVLQLHAFPMAFFALDEASLWIDRFTRKGDIALLILPAIFCTFAGAWTHFGLGHLRLRSRVGVWAFIWLLTVVSSLVFQDAGPSDISAFQFRPHAMGAITVALALTLGWPVARALRLIWQGFLQRRRRKKRQQWRRWGVAW